MVQRIREDSLCVQRRKVGVRGQVVTGDQEESEMGLLLVVLPLLAPRTALRGQWSCEKVGAGEAEIEHTEGPIAKIVDRW